MHSSKIFGTVRNALILLFIASVQLTAADSFSQKTDESVILQQTEVRGSVLDENGQPLPGASIIVSGTTTGAVTDQDGTFLIEVAGPDAILIISFVGYTTQEITVGDQRTIDVSMALSAFGIDEVVSIGYGTMTKANLTGSVSHVSTDALMARPIADATAMLQGRMPGVQVVQNSGAPGDEGLALRIRGQGTYSSAGSNPLVLIDGVSGSLSDLNPNDIESVSVLKDAASAAIYGSRAANGVILVTTKDGSERDGKMVVAYNFNYGIHNPTKLYDLIDNSVEYMEMFNIANENTSPGFDPVYTPEMINQYRNATDRVKYPNANWMDIMHEPAGVQMHNLSVSGGGKTHYNLSLGYVDQPGVQMGYHNSKYNARLNVGSQVSKRLKVGINIGLKQNKRKQPNGGQTDNFISLLAHAPTALPTLPDGSGRYTGTAYVGEGSNKNQYAVAAESSRYQDSYALTSQVYADLEIIEGLHLFAKGAANMSYWTDSHFAPVLMSYYYHEPYGEQTAIETGRKGLTKGKTQNIYTNVYTYLQYDKHVGRHNIGVMAGYSQEENNYETLTGYRVDFPKQILQELNAGGQGTQENSGTSNSWALMSGFGRLSYNFDERYLLEVNMRYDGTSRLHQDYRWGFFPSVSGAWRISEESFMESLDPVLSFAKIRGSWGQLGNQNIGLYPYQALIGYTDNYSYDNASLSTGAAQTSLSNEMISWETTTVLDFGIDFTLFHNLSVSFDWYTKETTDILRNAQVTKEVGLGAPVVNSGAMKNTGIDLDIHYHNRVKSGALGGFGYDLGFTLGHFKNEIVTFGSAEDQGNIILEEGRPWNTNYLLEWIGIFQNQAEIDNSPVQFGGNYTPGDLKYKDQNGDNVIDNDDRIPMEDGVFPAFDYSFSLNFDWKGFDISCFLMGVQGRSIYATSWGITAFEQGAPPTTNWRDAWSPTNPSNELPKLYYGSRHGYATKMAVGSDFYLFNASYFRLKNLQIGYTLPSKWTNKIKIEKVRIYFSGDNLATVSDYPGLDPERAGNGVHVAYPQNKIVSFGINVEF